ncbi:MAG TPA: class I SAM-dependent methyltransferase [Pseudomonadales bacterium]
MDVDEVRTAYDTVAKLYHTRFADELAQKPFDRAWLDRFAEGCARDDRVIEVGCGDGHVAAYLAKRGVRVEGLDLSSEMVAVARTAYPALAFASGNLLALPLADASVDAIVAFYSIVNLEAHDCVVAFGEFRRVLRANGRVTLAFHIGAEKLRLENWWETGANLDFHLHPLERVCEQLRAAAFEVVECTTRKPYAENVEAQTRRAYVLARAR